MAEKKYYWLKMTDQFFEDKAIKKLRKIAGGDTYTIIYLKMLLTAIKQGNKMYFEGIEDDFMEELALELDEDTDNVKVTLLHIIFQRHHSPFDEVLSKPKWAQVLMLESMQIQLKEEEKQRKKKQGIIEDEEGGE